MLAEDRPVLAARRATLEMWQRQACPPCAITMVPSNVRAGRMRQVTREVIGHVAEESIARLLIRGGDARVDAHEHVVGDREDDGQLPVLLHSLDELAEGELVLRRDESGRVAVGRQPLRVRKVQVAAILEGEVALWVESHGGGEVLQRLRGGRGAGAGGDAHVVRACGAGVWGGVAWGEGCSSTCCSARVGAASCRFVA